MSSFGNLTGKRAIVAGGSSGIGQAIAIEFARAGADVIVHFAKSHAAANVVSEEARGLGVRSITLAADFSDGSEIEPFVDRAFSVWNGLDIWVQNAGVDLLTGGATKLSYAAKLERLFDVDVRAGMLLTKQAAFS